MAIGSAVGAYMLLQYSAVFLTETQPVIESPL